LLSVWFVEGLEPRLAGLVRGRPRVLVSKGQIHSKRMRRAHVTKANLCEALRSHGWPARASDVAEAELESSGRISVVPRHRPES
jgi:uncharacterized membrane protein YcaP (DUF421 family)